MQHLFLQVLHPPFSSAWLEFPPGPLQDLCPSLENPSAAGRDLAKSRKTSGKAGKFAELKSLFSTDLLQENTTGEEQSGAGPCREIPPSALPGNIPMIFPQPRARTAQVQVCPGFPHSVEDIDHPESL